MSGQGSTTPAAVGRHLSVGLRPVEQEWEFFCECGCYGCDKRVKLTVAAYRVIHDGGGFVLAPGHRCSERERPRESSEEAKSSRAQAELQVQRARKNLRRP